MSRAAVTPVGATGARVHSSCMMLSTGSDRAPRCIILLRRCSCAGDSRADAEVPTFFASRPWKSCCHAWAWSAGGRQGAFVLCRPAAMLWLLPVLLSGFRWARAAPWPSGLPPAEPAEASWAVASARIRGAYKPTRQPPKVASEARRSCFAMRLPLNSAELSGPNRARRCCTCERPVIAFGMFVAFD